MFDHFVWSVLVAPALVAVAVRVLADRLAPGRAARVVAWSAAATAVGSMINLLVFTLVAVAETPAAAEAFGWSARTVHDDTAQVAWVPWLSVALLAGAAGAVAVRARRHRRTLAEARRYSDGTATVLVLPDARPQAFAVPGRPGRVVVTTGMREQLSEPQFDAVIAHERAHLEAGHHRLVAVADVAAASHPALWWVARHVGYLVERAADEQAARAVGSRRTVAHAIGTASLAGAPAAGLGLHAAARPGVVPRRVASLLRPPRQAGWPWYVLPAALAASSLVWTVEAVVDFFELLASASLPG
ncbi:M56 family metallopeptidase [Catellatospora bangladeshensis]|uniref:Membrane protein n=1 Tax=Catellatospora bangladeshensis TaxID=310355 RepID=A0A8J3JE99_9ACTN|nr:M56 family metallopeptidase [Catellatospora bangladeshensis]GIF82851.1 membrane protein [Catellatospora bangladeshensis]